VRQKSARKALAIICGCLLVGAWAAAQGKSNKMESKLQQKQPPDDPRAFASAEEMFKVANKTAFNPTAAALLRDVDRQIAAGDGIDSDALFAKLLDLNPFRCTTEVQSAVATWVGPLAKRLASTIAADANTVFRQANELYTAGKLAQARDAYRRVLHGSPGHLDARNNLALTLLHEGNDLAAEVELEIVRRAAPDYVPALVNLTVVGERIGQSDQARQLAKKTAEQHKDVAAAVYNDLWYDSLQGNPPGLAKRIEALIAITDRPAYRQLQRLQAVRANPALAIGAANKNEKNDKAKKDEVNWGNGLARIWGRNPGLGMKIFGVVVFVLLSLVVCVIAAAQRRNSLVVFLVLGTVLFFVFWGFSLPNLVGSYIVFCWLFGWLTTKLAAL
jgi:tetratricopeptide (TPR) repeat protein